LLSTGLTIKKQRNYNEKIHFHSNIFLAVRNNYYREVKPPELSIIYPDPTFNNLLVIQESVQDTLVKSTVEKQTKLVCQRCIYRSSGT
jgi:hypothetical protein